MSRRRPSFVPETFDAESVLAFVREAAQLNPKLRLWTTSRILNLLGMDWELPHRRRERRAVDRALAALAEAGHLRRRPLAQTSRNERTEVAYELVPLDATENPRP